MKKQNKFILAGGLVVLVVLVGWFFFGRGTDQIVTTALVKSGDLVQTVEVTGDVQAVDDIDLAFSASGSVAQIDVEVGDLVEAGALLASLDTDELEAAVAQAQESVSEIQAELALKNVGVSVEEVAVAEADLLVAQAGLSAAETSLSEVQAVVAAALASASSDLEHVKNDTEQDLTDARTDVLEAMRSVLAKIRAGLADADTVLGVENTLFDDEFDDVLSNQNRQSAIDARESFDLAADARDQAEDDLLDCDPADDANLAVVMDAVDTAYELAYETLLNTNRALDATEVDSLALSSDDLIAFKTTMSAAQTALLSAGSTYTSTKQSLTTARLALTQEVEAAESDLTETQAAQDQDLAKAQAAVVSRQADLVKAQAQLDKILAKPRNVDLASLEARERGAQAQYLAALARLRQAQIISPITGRVAEIEVDIGEQATAGETVFSVISTGDDLEINLDIPESDLGKVAVDQAAKITLDAFGDDVIFTGRIVFVYPAEKIIEGVVFYQAKIVFDQGQDLSAVKPGMSADVTISTAQRTGVLYVPSRAVLERDNVKYVRMPSDGSYLERNVTVGLHADDGLVEITSGLTEGEEVIVSIR